MDVFVVEERIEGLPLGHRHVGCCGSGGVLGAALGPPAQLIGVVQMCERVDGHDLPVQRKLASDSSGGYEGPHPRRRLRCEQWTGAAAASPGLSDALDFVHRAVGDARWLRRKPTTPGSAGRVVVAQILDEMLFAPARPDRRSAADWALRMAKSGCAGTDDPLVRLTALCLAAHTDPSAGRGCAETDRIARECGLVPTALFPVLDRMATSLVSWSVALASGDLRWELLPKGDQCQQAVGRTGGGGRPEG